MTNLEFTIKSLARECGFDLAGISSAEDFASDRDAALERVREGRMDGLPWYTESRVIRGTSPSELLPGATSIICLGLSYWRDEDRPGSGSCQASDLPGETVGPRKKEGRVGRYAWVRDYHRVMKRRMREFVRSLERELDAAVAARWYVDDGPMLDRAAARRAGIGWFGKNTNILTPEFGSWVFLGQVITDLDLKPDAPLKKSCGSCTRCIEDCPTGALVAPYVLDNSLCISYLTIENRGAIPRDLRPLIGDWVFGCDICQNVCPVNRKAGLADQPIPMAALAAAEGPNQPLAKAAGSGFLDPVGLLEMSEQDFLDRFAGTSIMRAKRTGMQRNACVALGNIGDETSLPALRRVLLAGEPLVRGHAAWALGRIGGETAKEALTQAAILETDEHVLEEIEAARLELVGG